MKEPITLYRWRVRDGSRRSGWRELGWMMTEDDALARASKNGWEIEKLPGTMVVCQPIDVMPTGGPANPDFKE